MIISYSSLRGVILDEKMDKCVAYGGAAGGSGIAGRVQLYGERGNEIYRRLLDLYGVQW